jgi:Spy/CpxP family protein refolding chaperone
MKTNQVFKVMAGAVLLSGAALAEPEGPQGQGPRGGGQGFRPEGPMRERMQQRGGPEGFCPAMQGRGPGAEGGCPMMGRRGPGPDGDGPRQPRGGFGPGMEIGRRGFHNPERLKEAGATDKQLEALKAFANEQQLKRIDLQAAAEKAELALDQLMDSETADSAAALKAADALSQARAELFKLEIGSKLKIRELLGADVLKKLREMGPPAGRGPRPEGAGQPRPGRAPAAEAGRPAANE